MISIIIAHKNNHALLAETIRLLSERASGKYPVEIIVADDNSRTMPTPKTGTVPVRVVAVPGIGGVGAAFDAGVAQASHNILFLIGSDVVVPDNWDKHVFFLACGYPNSVICGQCVDAQNDKTMGYGATIAWLMGSKNTPAGTNIIQARWNRTKKQDTPFDVACVLGAAYVTTKSFYNHIHGWTGHRRWGCLEPFISIKAWLSGGQCLCDPSFVVGHHFGRYKNNSEVVHDRPIRPDWMMYNRLFIAETMLTDNHKQVVYDHLQTTKSLGLAIKHLHENIDIVRSERAHNQKIFIRDSNFLWKNLET